MVKTGQFKNLGLGKGKDIQSALLTAIARSAEDLTNGKGWPDGVDELLESLGNITKVSRVWIFQTLKLTDDYIIQDYTFEWSSKKEYDQIGLPIFSRFTTKIDQPDYKKMIESRILGEYQTIITSELKPSRNKTNLEKQKIKSMLTIPIFVENKWWGTLGFDDCERKYNWSDIEIALLRTVGFLISSAVLRDKLSAKRKQLDILQQITEYTMWQFDLNRKYLWCASGLFSTTPNKTDHFQFSFKDMLKIIHPNDRESLLNTVKDYIKTKNEKFRCDIRILTENKYNWIELIGAIDNNTKHSQIMGIAIDITNRKKKEKELKIEATTDPLTGIINRRRLEQIIQDKLNSEIFSFLILDVDFFKKINDTYGHPLGDKILIHIVKICQEQLRKDDYIARIGGEEFAILLPCIGKKESSVIANRIKEKIQNTPFLEDEKTIYCTVSIGCMTNVNQYSNISEIYKLADSALYRAKNSGRNLVCTA